MFNTGQLQSKKRTSNADIQGGKHLPLKPFFQPRLSINQPNDIYEQEADTMADKVIGTNSPGIGNNFFNSSPLHVQRKCQHCEEEEGKMQRKESTAESMPVPGLTENYISCLNGKGAALTNNERDFFEPKFGHDFSDVRLHTDSAANQSAKEVNAFAYTHGSNIVFGSNQYQPGTENGKRLMAHELTHVVQQKSNVQTKLIQRDGPPGGDPTQRDPFYVQPGGPFDVGDNIFTLQWGPDGLKFGFPFPRAAPGADNGSITLLCPAGQRRVWRTGGCCDAGNYNAATDTCCEDGKVPQGTSCVDASTPGITPPVAPPTVQPGVPGLGNCPPHSIPFMGRCLNLDAPQPQPQPQPGGAQPQQGLSGTYPTATIDDFNIDEATLNSRQQGAYQTALSRLRLTLHNCPGSLVTITGYADAPGNAAHNMQLSQNRADSTRLRLMVDLLSPGAASPTIVARGDGTNNPVDSTAGYSARNRRVEIETALVCPPLSSTLTPPSSGNLRH
jgi:outer membrane protein OmpA-like peptidoglycan-associated protein